MSVRAVVLAGGLLLVGACQSMGRQTPAVLASGDEASIAALKAALAKAVGRAQVELGPGDPTQVSVVSVLPPRLGAVDDRSLALPTAFRLEIEGETCFVVREESGARTAIEGATCRPAG